jgi:hypothetical protein
MKLKEYKINLKLQKKYNKKKINKFMRIISLPFNRNILNVIILVLFVNEIISIKDIFIIVLSAIYIIILKTFFARTRPFAKNKLIENRTKTMLYNN